jgi:hypothetical protein
MKTTNAQGNATNAQGNVSDEQLAVDMRAAIELHAGSEGKTAMALGISRATVARIAGGRPIHRCTAIAVRAALNTNTATEPEPAA